MKSRHLLALTAVLPFLYDTSSQPLEYVRRAERAAAERDWAGAVEWLTAAAERTTDPGLVAYNRGVACYRLGRYREAELHFRRALEDAEGDRLVFAWFGLANALLQRSRGEDRALLLDAARAYRICARVAAARRELQSMARRNLETCLLLLEQAQENARRDPRGSTQSQKGKTPGKNGGEPGQHPRSGNGETNGKKIRNVPTTSEAPDSTNRPQPGKGRLPVLVDDTELQRLAPEDVEAILRSAWQRIDSARRRTAQQSRIPARNVPDW